MICAAAVVWLASSRAGGHFVLLQCRATMKWQSGGGDLKETSL